MCKDAAQIAKSKTFPSAVTNSVESCQRLLMKPYGFRPISQIGICVAQIMESTTLPLAVADFPRDDELLFSKFDGMTRVTQIRISLLPTQRP